MVATVSSLLRTQKLGLRLVTSAAPTERPVEWVAVTELLEPHPFLTGRQIVLTTGMRLRGARTCRAFVKSVASADSAGLGFGVGFNHESVPPAIIEAADEMGLPVFEVPFRTPFAAIVKTVADAATDERYAALAIQQRQQQQLVTTLMSDAGLEGLLARVHDYTGAHIAVVRYGELVAGTIDVDDPAVTGWDALPVAAGPTSHATLHVSKPHSNASLISYARSLISLHLEQDRRQMQQARESAGLVLSDLIRGRLAAEEAELRLGAIGVRSQGRARVLILHATGGRSGELAALPLPSLINGAASGMVDGQLVVLLSSRVDARAASDALLALARSAGIQGQIGIGDAYPISLALRWSYFEARDAMQHLGRDRDVAESTRLSIASLLLTSRDVPVAELADEILAPLDKHDREHGSQLVQTLDVWLTKSGAAAVVAAELGTHRNTVRYRLDQIAQLTGLDPRITGDAVQLWLARAARRLISGSSGA